MPRVLVVYGTRPELIKLAPVVFALRAASDKFDLRTCSTGQHKELVKDLEELFGIHPDYELGLMAPKQELNQLAAAGLARVDSVIRETAPDWTLVQGDTTTALFATLAAFHLRCRVAHVEAGLRTGNLKAPFPEEANRRLVDALADLLFAPTQRSAQALLDEGCDPARVVVTGNTVVDTLHWVAGRAGPSKPADEVLITVHRRESFGEPLEGILGALRELAARHHATRWVFPVHPNPNVKGPAERLLGGLPNVSLIEPLRYDEFVVYLRRARLVLTDSGGLQEEAPTFGVPVLVLRDGTERKEGLETGVARLIGRDRAAIVAAVSELLSGPEGRPRDSGGNPYGDGQAATRILSALAGAPVAPFTGP